MKLRTVGVVLRHAAFGNTSQVVHMLTEDLGLVGALAKGVWRRNNPLFDGGFDLGACHEFVLIPRAHGALGLITEAQEIYWPRGLRRSRARMADAFLVLAFAGRFAVSGPGQDGLFAATRHALLALDGGSEDALLAFLRAGLETVGSAPRLDACAQCGAPRAPAAYCRLDPQAGGVVCARHDQGGTRRVSRSVLDVCLGGGSVADRGVREEAVRVYIDWANRVLGFRSAVLQYPFYMRRTRRPG